MLALADPDKTLASPLVETENGNENESEAVVFPAFAILTKTSFALLLRVTLQ